jgi:predicted ATPase
MRASSIITTIAGYQVQDQLHESRSSLVYRARRGAENQPVVLKMLKQAYPSPKQIAAFRREYELICSLQSPGVIRAHDLTADQNRLVMVLEDFGGQSLAQFLRARRFSIGDALSLAIRMTDIVGQVHRQQVIHKDVTPSNFIWNPEIDQIKLIDFGIATCLTRENPVLAHPTGIEGTLAYIAPEQTGRMNRIVDYRTDFYSLGVSFYEMLTGQLPFATTDALALVHAHIAQQPIQPHEISPDVPPSLSAIVMKLMAKNAEDRYQSASGLKADLEECARQWRTRGKIGPFLLGQQDVMERFHIPQKLYGREDAVATLLTAFARVSQGTSEIILVSGPAGIGKSTLVRAIHGSITEKRGYFAAGKFDQFHRDILYESLALAFRSLLRQLLTEGAEQIETWRDKLLAALGPNGQVMIDVIPELELLVGPQPSVPALPPLETQNRFQFTFRNFVHVFTHPRHPLVLFLDDLQWADAASLNLLQLLMTTPENHHLLVIGAYRDDDMREAHPLLLMLDEVRKSGRVVSHISVGPLSLPDIEQFIADTLSCTLERATPLAELVLAKTDGNPFFVNEFLKSLHTEGLLRFDIRQGWQWNAAHIKEQAITDNVVELMSSKMQKLPRETQTALKLAACIGNQFALRTLALICEKSPAETAADLWLATLEGLVVPLGDAYKLADLDWQGLTDEVTVEYKFAHDRIQQAAYSLISQADQPAVHRQVGRLLLREMPSGEHGRKIFAIVNNLNRAKELIAHPEEQEELAALNLLAGRRAKAAAAYKPALHYLEIGVDLLPKDAWAKRYDLALALYMETSEVAYLSADFGQMERLSTVVLQQAKTRLDKVQVYEVHLHACTARNNLLEGIKTGLQALQLLGVRFREQPSQMDIQYALEETKRNLAGRTLEELRDLPEMTDPYHLASIRILSGMMHLTKMGFPQLFPLVVCAAVNLSVQYGNTALSAQAYVAYGLLLCGVTEEIDAGYQFGGLALNIVERFNAKELQTNTIYLVTSFTQHWKEHVRDTLKPLLEGYRIGLETGDLNFAALSIFGYIFKAYWVGHELPKLEQEIVTYNETIRQLKKDFILDLNRLYRQVVLNLLGRSEDPCRLIGKSYNEEQMLPHLLETNNRNAIGHIALNKLILCYLFQAYPQAVQHAIKTEEYLDSLTGTVAIPFFHMYDSLAKLAVWFDTQESERSGACISSTWSKRNDLGY